MDRGRVVSGDYRGFVMIWDMEDIATEMRQFEKNRKKKAEELFIFFLKTPCLCSSHSRVSLLAFTGWRVARL